jgi:hypothetical protein
MSVAIQASSFSSENPAPLGAVASTNPPAAIAGSSTDGAEQFRSVLGSLGRAIDNGEKLVGRALSPSAGALGAAELIALQAGIYRYSEAVDLAAKLVDRAGTAVRTTLQAGGQ